MTTKYHGIANTNEFGLISGKEYIIENTGLGLVYVYDINENYLTSCRSDSFNHIKVK